jgi:PBP1b-binding outer membrane lipoprotein LpoB
VKRAAAALAAAALLAGCSSNAAAPERESTGTYYVEKVNVDGRQVTCVVWSGIEKGGVDCDWERAR